VDFFKYEKGDEEGAEARTREAQKKREERMRLEATRRDAIFARMRSAPLFPHDTHTTRHDTTRHSQHTTHAHTQHAHTTHAHGLTAGGGTRHAMGEMELMFGFIDMAQRGEHLATALIQKQPPPVSRAVDSQAFTILAKQKVPSPSPPNNDRPVLSLTRVRWCACRVVCGVSCRVVPSTQLNSNWRRRRRT
jgi:hypothetical protein